MSLIVRLLRALNLHIVLVALVSGGLIHILTTLMMPRFATANGVTRLSNDLPTNKLVVLPPGTATPKDVPFISTEQRLAVCRYDVSEGPVEIKALLPDRGWSLGLYTLEGDNFHVLSSHGGRQKEIAFRLVAAEQRSFGFFQLGRGPIDRSASQVTVPQPRGLLVIRAPLLGRAYAGETDATLHRADCAPIGH